MKEHLRKPGYFGPRIRLDEHRVGTEVFILSRNPKAVKRELSGRIVHIGKQEQRSGKTVQVNSAVLVELHADNDEPPTIVSFAGSTAAESHALYRRRIAIQFIDLYNIYND